MAPLTSNVQRSHKVHPRDINIAPVNAGSKLFVGGYVCREAATGVVIPGADVTGLIPLGVAVEPLFPSDPDKTISAAFDNTGGADGTITGIGEGTRCVRYDQSGEYLFAVTGSTPKVGEAAYLVDDNTVAITSTNLVKAGEFTRPGQIANTWFVDISKRSGVAGGVVGVEPQTAPDELTGTVGTANDVLQALPTLTDTPASADALRDDLTTNWAPVINNNVADIQAKLTALINALIAAGVLTAGDD